MRYGPFSDLIVNPEFGEFRAVLQKTVTRIQPVEGFYGFR